MLSRLRCFWLARIIGVLLAAAVLAACSAVKLAYNNLPELSYWWLDGYLDFDGAQTPRVRDELTELREEDYLFLFSRLRRCTTSLVPLRVRAATNPGNVGHDWVKQRFIEGAALVALGIVLLITRLAN